MSKCAEFKLDLICEIIFDKFFPGVTGIRTHARSPREKICQNDFTN